MNLRVVVADEREANFFDVEKPQADLSACGSLHNDAARPDRELETDRPGRRFSGADGQSARGRRRTQHGTARDGAVCAGGCPHHRRRAHSPRVRSTGPDRCAAHAGLAARGPARALPLDRRGGSAQRLRASRCCRDSRCRTASRICPLNSMWNRAARKASKVLRRRQPLRRRFQHSSRLTREFLGVRAEGTWSDSSDWMPEDEQVVTRRGSVQDRYMKYAVEELAENGGRATSKTSYE